jgi:prepilin-type processing-associated H-X9-DG protein
MPIAFTCPHCGATTNVADEYAGQMGPCARCGKTITIPYPGGTPFADAPPRRKTHTGVLVLVILLAVSVPMIGILLALLLPAVQAAREAARRAACINNMKQLGLSLHNFHDANKHFPAIVDPDNPQQPPCSWRVQVLPYVEENARFQQYDPSQPWNGPNNRMLEDPMPTTYRCPSNPDAAGLDTDYLAVVGPKAVFRDVGSTSFRNITDGTSNTIMLAESHTSGIHWMEPRDMKTDDLSFGVNSRAGGIQSTHPGVANVLMADGSVRSISDSTDPEVLKAMTTIDGREPAFNPY